MTGPMAPPDDSTVGDRILVNGRYAPYLDVDTHRYRLRLLNASPFTTYDFALSDGRPFVQVGTGNGLLPKAVVRQDILLGPAQRADVVVDFRGELGKDVVLESVPRIERTAGAAGSPSAQIMQFRVRHQVSDNSRLPVTLQPAPKLSVPSKVSAVWTWDSAAARAPAGSGRSTARRSTRSASSTRCPRAPPSCGSCATTATMTHYVHLHEELWRTVLARRQAAPAVGARARGHLAAGPGRAGPGGRQVHRLHRRLHDPLPHARPRGRRDDGAVRRGQPEHREAAEGVPVRAQGWARRAGQAVVTGPVLRAA